MREIRRKKPTPLGWVTLAILIAVFLFVYFLWIAPHVREDPIGTMTRIIILLFIFAVALSVVKKLGGKRLFRE